MAMNALVLSYPRSNATAVTRIASASIPAAALGAHAGSNDEAGLDLGNDPANSNDACGTVRPNVVEARLTLRALGLFDVLQVKNEEPRVERHWSPRAAYGPVGRLVVG